MQDSNNYLDINEQEFIDCCFGNMKFWKATRQRKIQLRRS